MKAPPVFVIALACAGQILLAQEQTGKPHDAAVPPPASKAEIEATWKTACEWAVGSAAQRVRAARAKMVEYGRPGLDHVLTRLASEDGLELESVQAVVDGFGALAATALMDVIEAEKGEIALRQGLHLLGVIRKKIEGSDLDRARAFILSKTSSEAIGVRLRALLIASDYELREAIPAAVSLAKHEKESVRRSIAQMLGRFGGEEAVQPLLGFLDDPLMTVRFPAQYSLAQCGSAAMPALAAAVAEAKNPIARNHMLMAIGSIGADDAPGVVLGFIENPDPVCRGFAVRALSNWLQARRSSLESTPDGPAKTAARDALKESASRLRAAVPDDAHHFVRAQVEEFDRLAAEVAALR